MFKATHIIKKNKGDHSFKVGAKVLFATEAKMRLIYDDETISNGKWFYGTEGRRYYVMEDEHGLQQSVLETEFTEIE